MAIPIHCLFQLFLDKVFCNSLLPSILIPFIQLLTLTVAPFKHHNIPFSALVLALGSLALFCRTFEGLSLQYGLCATWFYYLSTVSKLLFAEPSIEGVFWCIGQPRQGALHMKSPS